MTTTVTPMTNDHGDRTHMPSDADIAQMRAYLLKSQEPQQPVYDDGASMLGGDPNMQQVGLFGFGKGPKPVKPPLDVQRRALFGLPETPTFQPPAVIPPKTPTITDLVPQSTRADLQPPVSQPSSPLTDLANKAINTPMTRRDVLNRAKNAAVSHVVRGAVGDITPTDLPKLPDVAAPLAEVAKEVVPTATSSFASIIPLMDKAFRERTLDAIQEQMDAGDWGSESAYGFYDEIRHHLQDKIPKKDLNTLDKYSDALHNSYRQISEGRQVPARHYNMSEKFNTLLNKHIHHVPIDEFLGNTEYTREVGDKDYMTEILENEDFQPDEIKQYLQHHDIDAHD